MGLNSLPQKHLSLPIWYDSSLDRIDRTTGLLYYNRRLLLS